MDYAIERQLPGSSRAIGIFIHRIDYSTSAYHEVEIHLWAWTLLVSLPTQPRVAPPVQSDIPESAI